MPGESHGQRSLAGYSPWGRKELDMTEVTLQQQQQYIRASLVAQMVKNLPAMQEIQDQSQGQEDPLEKGMATHSSVLAWRFPWTEEPGRLQSMGLRRVRHD